MTYFFRNIKVPEDEVIEDLPLDISPISVKPPRPPPAKIYSITSKNNENSLEPSKTEDRTEKKSKETSVIHSPQAEGDITITSKVKGKLTSALSYWTSKDVSDGPLSQSSSQGSQLNLKEEANTTNGDNASSGLASLNIDSLKATDLDAAGLPLNIFVKVSIRVIVVPLFVGLKPPFFPM